MSFWLLGKSNRLQVFFACVRVAVLITLIGYPWDFFAIRLGVWDYPNDPGSRLYGVPLNDLWFMLWSTHFASCLLIASRRRYSRNDGHPKREDTSQDNAGRY